MKHSPPIHSYKSDTTLKPEQAQALDSSHASQQGALKLKPFAYDSHGFHDGAIHIEVLQNTKHHLKRCFDLKPLDGSHG